MKKLAALLLCWLLAPALATAAEVQAEQVVQGGVLQLRMTSLPTGTISVSAFGKNWPTKAQSDGAISAWIGVDMEQAPGNYPLTVFVVDGQGITVFDQKLTLAVVAGNFRVSHISVQKQMAEFDAATLARIANDQQRISASYQQPVDVSPDIGLHGLPIFGELTTPFGARRYVNNVAKSPHNGVDLAAHTGTPVLAPLAGQVLLTAELFLTGNTVVIGHGNGLYSVYCHLHAIHVHEREWIEDRAVVGEVGSTGRSTGPHLHWGVRFNGARIDPLALL